jgi:hypothetical protein
MMTMMMTMTQRVVPTAGVVSEDATTAATATTATTATGAATGANTAGTEKAKPVVVGLEDKLLLFKSDTPIQGDLPITLYINKLSCAF